MVEAPLRIGLIINPIAGMGGKVGLHGTDGDLYERARELGAIPIARDRALQTLFSIADLNERVKFVVPIGAMGGDVAADLGFETEVITHSLHERTSAFDTKEVAQIMMRSGVSLILFAGGDGTARDIHEIVGEQIPMLGIPSGVKMRSGVFSTSPEAAGELVRRLVLNPESTPLRRVEILDLILEEASAMWPPSRFFGIAIAPFAPRYLQMAKSMSSVQGDVGIDELAKELAFSLKDDSLYLIGPGTTTHKILDALGIVGSVGGVDAIFQNRLVGRDLSEAQILELLQQHDVVVLFLGIIGGQGFLLGRGNQQLSAKVVELVGLANIVLISNAEKIVKLFPPCLHVDLNDSIIESTLVGYRQVLVAPNRSMVCQIVVPNRFQQEPIAV